MTTTTDKLLQGALMIIFIQFCVIVFIGINNINTTEANYRLEYENKCMKSQMHYWHDFNRTHCPETALKRL